MKRLAEREVCCAADSNCKSVDYPPRPSVERIRLAVDEFRLGLDVIPEPGLGRAQKNQCPFADSIRGTGSQRSEIGQEML
jgi:hypothetical protein